MSEIHGTQVITLPGSDPQPGNNKAAGLFLLCKSGKSTNHPISLERSLAACNHLDSPTGLTTRNPAVIELPLMTVLEYFSLRCLSV